MADREPTSVESRTLQGAIRPPSAPMRAAMLALFGVGMLATALPGAFGIGIVLFLAALMMALGRRHGIPKKRVPAELVLREDGIGLPDRVLRRAAVREVRGFAGDEGRHFVQAWTSRFGPPTTLELGSSDDVEAMLATLGASPSAAAERYRCASPLYASPGRQMLWSLSAIFVPLGLGFLAVRIGAPLVANVMTLVMMLASLLTVLFWPAEVRIGKDGVSTRWLRRNQFIPIGSIRDADVGQVGIGNGKRVAVRVVLRGEDPVWIPVGMVGIGDGKAFEMSTRIKKAIADAAAEPQSALEQLRRGSAQPREWLARLHRIGAGAQTGPRSAAVTHEQLWRVVESPAASPLDRAAAAIALGKSGDASAKQRLHRIATTSAMPKLRVALDAAADEATEEQQLIEALEAIGEEKQGDARR